MSQSNSHYGERPGPIAYMAGNGVAANLLMIAIIAAGLVALTGLEREAWPTIPFNHIEVSVAYPGATPDEVEEAIVVKIEDHIGGLEDVKTLKSVAAPGMGSVRAQLKSGADVGAALDEIKAAVDRIQSFPAAAERAVIREMTNRQSIIRLIIHGQIPARALKELAYQVEDKLTTLPDVSEVEVTGIRDYEISIEVPLQRLRALSLTLEDIAATVRQSSLDLSAGSLDTNTTQVRVRTLGQRYTQQDFEDIVILSRSDGTVVRLGDIARVRDDFSKSDLIVRHQNRPAAFIEVYRADGEPVTGVAEAVREHLAKVVQPALPEGVGITVWNDESLIYSERANLLVKNGLLGLLLVFIALTLFLEIRLALWVAVGLALSGIGALAVMLVFDLSLSSISLFTFVLAIGIVVDDAIVVAEHIHHERKQGTPGVVAAIRGARRIKGPLTFAVLTSVVAFAPLLFLPGGIGDIMRPVPIVLISMLLISLVESLLILPNHLSHLPGPEWTPRRAPDRFFHWTQGHVDRGLERFLQGPLERALGFAIRQPVIIIAGAIGTLIVCVSMFPAGIIKTAFAEEVAGDFVTASLEMPEGTTAGQTYKVASALEAAGRRVIERLERTRPEHASLLLDGVTVVVGQRARIMGGGVTPTPTLNPEANIATVEFKLLSAQQRTVTSEQFLQLWRAEVGLLPQVRNLIFSSELVDWGNPIEAILSHPDPARLTQIVSSVADELRAMGGVFDVRSDNASGVREIQIEMRPEARTLGLSLDDVAHQARAAFFGAEALRIQRGREEVRAYVRLPEAERQAITDVEGYLIRTPGGVEVPLSQIAELTQGISPSAIKRRDRQRAITVTADVDQSIISGAEANKILEDTILAQLIAANPGLTYRLGGEQQQQVESFDALNRSMIIAIFVIYCLLAAPLRSYSKPFIIMAVIPFGLAGAILGHLILGLPFSSASAFGFIGLSGVVVNDSLVMIDFINQRLREGAPAREAIIDGAKMRFRPIFLTSITTFLGFMPIILERAIHAKFLTPFAASLGFGILFTTVILMLLVPAIMAIHLRAK